jgi:phosphoribosylformylglycinamidine cyclo-ligase
LLDSKFPDTDKTLGEVLLTPTEIYTLDCLALIKSLGTNLRTFVHVTGGGLAENTARVIPAGLCATYDRGTWALPAEMLFMAKAGDVAQPALERTWNAGVGMVAIVDPEVADLTLRSLAARGMKAWIAGEVRSNAGDSSSNQAPARSTLEGTYQAR